MEEWMVYKHYTLIKLSKNVPMSYPEESSSQKNLHPKQSYNDYNVEP